jgi:multiple sugar transport system permease protein
MATTARTVPSTSTGRQRRTPTSFLVRRYSSWVVRGILAVVVACIMLLPFAWMIGTSLKPPDEVIRFPPTFIPEHWDHFASYVHVVTTIPIVRYYLNSLTASISVTVACIFTCSLAGYIFEKFRFPGRNALFFVLLATMMVPFQVVLVPVYLLVRTMHLTNTLWALIVPGLVNAWGIFLMRQSMKSVPSELLDAARIDGASEMGIFLRIVVPISRTALAALSVFIFMACWNDFLWPLIVLDDKAVQTLQVGLAAFAPAFGITMWNIVMAATVMSILPIVAVFLLAQRQLIEGMTMGSLKG